MITRVLVILFFFHSIAPGALFSQDPEASLSSAEEGQLTVVSSQSFLNISQVGKEALGRATSNGLLGITSNARMNLSLLITHFQDGEVQFVRQQAPESSSSTNSTLSTRDNSLRSEGGRCKIDERADSRVDAAETSKSVSYFNAGEVTQRIRMRVYDSESIERYIEKLEKIREAVGDRFASNNLLANLKRLLQFEKSRQLLTTRNVDSTLGPTLAEFISAVQEYSSRPAKKINSGDRVRFEELKGWGQATEIELVTVALIDANVDTVEFSAFEVVIEPILPEQRRELFEWGSFGQLKSAKDTRVFQWPLPQKRLFLGGICKHNWFLKSTVTTSFVAANVRVAGNGFFPFIDKGFALAKDVSFPGKGQRSEPTLESGHFVGIFNWLLADYFPPESTCSSLLGTISQNRQPPFKGSDLFTPVSSKVFSLLPLQRIPR